MLSGQWALQHGCHLSGVDGHVLSAYYLPDTVRRT